jgi:hypothetical protein
MFMEGRRARPATLGIGAISLYALALAGCAIRSDLMAAAAGNAAALRPDPDHALVVFLRPGRYGGAIQAVVYDEETIVGVSSANTAIAYPTTPGPHRFMVVSEAADFLAADLRAGRVYYARVAPRMGAWRARFSLLPIDPRGQAHDLAAWLRRAQLVTMTEKTHRWDAENHASVVHKEVAFLRRWEEKPPAGRPTLRPEDGV